MMRATLHGPAVHIPPCRLPSGQLSAAAEVDLTPHQGGTARVYLTAAGLPAVNPDGDAYWQVADAVLPPERTDPVQTGTAEDYRIEPAQVVRGAGDLDAIPLASNQILGVVGFAWSPYTLGVDYRIDPAGLAWLTDGRRPDAGAEYPVEVVTVVSTPIYTSTPVALDLSQHAVTLFDLPA